MSLKEKLTKAFRTDPDKARNSNQSLVQRNTELSLLFQLEQRKVKKLEDENRALLERIQDLMTEEDESRVRRLVADRTKRKLVQLKAITKRTISSLEFGLKEFSEFIKDVDNAIDDESKSGALPVEHVHSEARIDFSAPKFNPTLNRIPESPMLNTSDLLLNNAKKTDSSKSKLCANVDKLAEIYSVAKQVEAEVNNLQSTTKQSDDNAEATTFDAESVHKTSSLKSGDLSSETSISSEEMDAKDSTKSVKNIETEVKRDNAGVKESSATLLKENSPLKSEVNFVNCPKAVPSTSVNKAEEPAVVEPTTNAVTATERPKTTAESDICKSPPTAPADTSHLNFEDALSYTINFNSAARNSSSFEMDRSPSFISMGGTLRPLHTSTPKIGRCSLQQPAAICAISSAGSSNAKNEDVFVPPRPPNGKKISAMQRRTKITERDNRNTNPIVPNNNEMEFVASSCVNREANNADVVFNPPVAVNVTARRNTNYSRCSDSFAVSDTTLVDNAELQKDPSTNDENRTVIKKRSCRGVIREADQHEDDEIFLGPPQQKRSRQDGDKHNHTLLNEKGDDTMLNNLTNVKVKSSSRDKALVGAKNQPDMSALSTTNNMSVSNMSENGRQRRAATLKVTSYKLPSIATKLRREV